MGLVEQIQKDMTAAMKSRDEARLSTLRMMKSALMNRKIEKMADLDEKEAQQVLSTLIKQRKDSIEQFTKGGRKELADKEAADNSLAACRSAAKTQVAGDDDGDPGERDDHQSEGCPAQRLGVQGVSEKVLAINSAVDAKGQNRGGEQAEDDAPDDAAPAGNEAESGDGRSSDRVHHGSTEARLFRRIILHRACGRRTIIGEPPAPRRSLELIRHQHPYARSWK